MKFSNSFGVPSPFTSPTAKLRPRFRVDPADFPDVRKTRNRVCERYSPTSRAWIAKVVNRFDGLELFRKGETPKTQKLRPP